jgi:hypothetical protein
MGDNKISVSPVIGNFTLEEYDAEFNFRQYGRSCCYTCEFKPPTTLKYKNYYKVIYIMLFVSFLLFSGVIYGLYDYINKNKFPPTTVGEYEFIINICGPGGGSDIITKKTTIICSIYNPTINLRCQYGFLVDEDGWEWVNKYGNKNDTINVEVYDNKECIDKNRPACCCSFSDQLICNKRCEYITICVCIVLSAVVVFFVSYGCFVSIYYEYLVKN